MTNRLAIVIGGSAGSLDVLLKVLPELHAPLSFPIIIVVHRKQGMDSLLNDLLAGRTNIPVKEVEEKESILPNTIYVAPSDYHLLIEKDYTFSLDSSEKINYSRPSIDVIFQSAAEVYGKGLTCILLSGSNADGVNGLISVNYAKGTAIVQDPATAQIEYMPAQALLRAKIDFIFTPNQIAHYINELNKN